MATAIGEGGESALSLRARRESRVEGPRWRSRCCGADRTSLMLRSRSQGGREGTQSPFAANAALTLRCSPISPRRLLLMIPTIFGIMLVSFAIVQFVPGGPVERAIAQLQGNDEGSTAHFGGGGGQIGAGAMAHAGGDISSRYRGAEGLDPKFIKELEQQYGFDKPAPERFWMLVRDYATFNLGKSYYRDAPVVELIKEKLPVSMSLGLWMTFISYAISIPLGVQQGGQGRLALRHLDFGAGHLRLRDPELPVRHPVGRAVLRRLVLADLPVARPDLGQFRRPLLAGTRSSTISGTSRCRWPSLVLGSFATSTLLTKNSFLDEIKKSYVQTARMKGLSERRVLYGHVFRNAMLIVIAGFPGAFIGAFFTGSLLIEQVFSLDGLGYLSYDSLDPARLSGRARHALCLRAARPGGEPDLRPHLHLDRSAHRFRNARGLMRSLAIPPAPHPSLSPQAGRGAQRRRLPLSPPLRGRAARGAGDWPQASMSAPTSPADTRAPPAGCASAR